MEYSTTLEFEDKPTFSIIYRNLEVPKYNTSFFDNCILIETENLKLQFCENKEPFNDNNLKIDFLTTKINQMKKKFILKNKKKYFNIFL